MAKKDSKKGAKSKGDAAKKEEQSADDIIDELEEDVAADAEAAEADEDSEEGADEVASDEDSDADGSDADDADDDEELAADSDDEDDSERTVADGGRASVARAYAAQGRRRHFIPWPVDPDHKSVTDMLMGAGGDPDVDISAPDDPMMKKTATVNIAMFVVLLAGIIGFGVAFNTIASAEAIEAKRREAREQEEKHLAEQMKLQKKYGMLRIETEPPQATVIKNGEKIVVKDEETGEELVGMSPMNIMDLDIGETHTILLEKEGYESFEFSIAEHVWTKDVATGEYKLIKQISLVPKNCEYWFLYDSKRKKEMKFEDQGSCLTYHDEQKAKQVTVTECNCKIPPEGVVPEKK